MSVLAWHQVADAEVATAVPPGTFAGQLDVLRRMKIEVVSLDDAVSGRRRGVVLTFDDGHVDTFTTAFPLLKARGLPATVYCVSGFVSTDRWFEAGSRSLTWRMLQELADAGWTIGSHTATHRPLVELSTAEVRRELRESRALIEDRLERRCEHFCAPYGAMDRRVLEEVLEAGYVTAAISVPARYRLPARHPAVIWRSGVYRGTSWTSFRVKARGWDRWLRGPWLSGGIDSTR